jgi:ankyrin repeat protein
VFRGRSTVIPHDIGSLAKKLGRKMKFMTLGLFILLLSFTNFAFANLNEDLINYAKNGYEDDLIDLLTNDYIKINFQDGLGNTALHYAALTNNPKIMTILTTPNPTSIFQLNYNIKNNSGDTPLTLSVLNCHACLPVLFKEGRVIDLESGPIHNISGQQVTALSLAVLYSKDSLAANLIRLRANTNVTNYWNVSKITVPILFDLVTEDMPLSLKEFLKVNNELNIRIVQHITPLMLAVKYGKLENIKALVDNGALLNLRDDSGNTALHYASKFISNANGDGEIWRTGKSMYDFLVNAGAREDYKNADGELPRGAGRIFGCRKNCE